MNIGYGGSLLTRNPFVRLKSREREGEQQRSREVSGFTRHEEWMTCRLTCVYSTHQKSDRKTGELELERSREVRWARNPFVRLEYCMNNEYWLLVMVAGRKINNDYLPTWLNGMWLDWMALIRSITNASLMPWVSNVCNIDRSALVC